MRVVVLSLLFLAGCSTTVAPPEPEKVIPETVKLDIAAAPGDGLNVSIQVFDSAQAPTSSVYVAAGQVREVEKRYMPYVLKQALDRSGYWGAVRVMPQYDPSAEINVEGRIITSSGMELAIEVRVTDATGHVWLDRVFEDRTDAIDYATDPDFVTDSFNDLYHRVANEMRDALSLVDRQRVINAALVVYGAELSPETFSRFLAGHQPGMGVTGLPAEDDPVLKNVMGIRDAEYLFADSVDSHYEQLYQTVGPTYAWWRYYSYELIEGNQRLEKIDATRGATKGSWYAMERIYKTFKEAKMNQDALRELSESFDRETSATTAKISGQVIELEGTLDEQYESWRQLLRQMVEL